MTSYSQMDLQVSFDLNILSSVVAGSIHEQNLWKDQVVSSKTITYEKVNEMKF